MRLRTSLPRLCLGQRETLRWFSRTAPGTILTVLQPAVNTVWDWKCSLVQNRPENRSPRSLEFLQSRRIPPGRPLSTETKE
jgi:hypothetical protein